MTVATKSLPDVTTMSAAVYKAAIDATAAVYDRLAGAFAPHEQDVGSPAPDLTLRVDAGYALSGGTLTEVAAQTVSGFTTPASGYLRIDRVVLDPATGAASRVAGTAQSVGSPTAVAPDIPTGYAPLCQVAFTDADTAITNDMITDERVACASFPRATQAEQEAGTTGAAAVTPQVQHYHQSAVKAWAYVIGAGTPVVGASYGVSSVTDNGVGVTAVNLSVTFSDSSYCILHGVISNSSFVVTRVDSQTTTVINMELVNAGNSPADPDIGFNVACLGDL